MHFLCYRVFFHHNFHSRFRMFEIICINSVNISLSVFFLMLQKQALSFSIIFDIVISDKTSVMFISLNCPQITETFGAHKCRLFQQNRWRYVLNFTFNISIHFEILHMMFWFEWIHGKKRLQQNISAIIQTKLLIFHWNWIYDITKNVPRFPILSSFDLLFRLNFTRYLSWINHNFVDWKKTWRSLFSDIRYAQTETILTTHTFSKTSWILKILIILIFKIT